MKTLYKITLLFVAVFTFSGCMAGRPLAASTNYSQGGPHVSLNIFYESLSPYGRWINYGGYGRAWIPRVNRGFRPYATNGHWIYSDYGWTWMSGYRWGWAPFHYGRWTFDDYYGWIWIPGTVWAPAWVAWRHSSSYYGWAPLGPGMNVSINIHIPARNWVFMPGRYMGYRNIHRYYRPWRQNTTIIRNTTIINNIYEQHNHHYFSGPTRRAVQQRTHRNIRPVRVFNSSSASASRVTSNGLRIYRPTISRKGREQASSQHRPRPVRVATKATDRRSESRTQSNRPTRRPSTERATESRKTNRSKATRPTKRVSQPERRIQRQGVRNNKSNGRTPSNVRTRTQRKTNVQPREHRTIQRPQPQRKRTETRSQNSRRQSPQRSRVQRRPTQRRSTQHAAPSRNRVQQRSTSHNRSRATRSRSAVSRRSPSASARHVASRGRSEARRR